MEVEKKTRINSLGNSQYDWLANPRSAASSLGGWVRGWREEEAGGSSWSANAQRTLLIGLCGGEEVGTLR